MNKISYSGCRSGVVTRTVAPIRLVGKMAHDNLVCPPSVPAGDYPARRLALYAFHPQLPRRRERLTLIRIFEEIRAFGYEGGYGAVRRYTGAWVKANGSATTSAFVPLTFAPGEAYQFDWSHEIVVLDGVTTTVKVAHVRLCHSRMMFVRAYPRETQEMVFHAHERAFAFFKGASIRPRAA